MAETYRFKQRPYKHQVAALKKLFSNGWGGALLMQPRTGKTKVCIDYASILFKKNQVSRVLVVCPVGVVDVWVEEIRKNCPYKWRITIWDKAGRKKVALPKWGRPILDFVLVNYDAFSTPGRVTKRAPDITNNYGQIIKRGRIIRRSRRRGGHYDTIRQLQAWQPDMMILDEAHRIKSATAKKTSSLQKLGRTVPYRVTATGTAVTKAKRVFDLYSQWNFLNPESPLVKNKTLGDFKEEFGVWTTRNGYPQYLREKNRNKLRRLLHAESFAVDRDECFDLPDAFPDQLIHIDLEESAEVYDRLAEDMVAKIYSGEITQATIKLVLGLRLSQVTSGLAKTEPSDAYPAGRLVRIGSEKLRILQSLLEDWFDQEEKMAVCARFRQDLADICALSTKLKVPPQLIMGGVSRHDKTKARLDFERKSGPALIVLNPKAAAEGIDLRSASTMIWYSLTDSFVEYAQTKDRIALSPRAVRYVYLLGRGTYDEMMYDSLQEDGNIVKAIQASPERLLRGFKN